MGNIPEGSYTYYVLEKYLVAINISNQKNNSYGMEQSIPTLVNIMEDAETYYIWQNNLTTIHFWNQKYKRCDMEQLYLKISDFQLLKISCKAPRPIIFILKYLAFAHGWDKMNNIHDMKQFDLERICRLSFQ